MIHVRPFEPADAGALAPRLRAADLREIDAATGERALDAIERCTRSSDPCLSVVDGQVIAVFGVVPDGPERGIVWMVGSDEIASRAIPFARIMRPWVGRLQERYRILWNFADARNEVHLRWIRWCGFTIHRTLEAHGVGRVPFCEFSRVRPGT